MAGQKEKSTQNETNRSSRMAWLLVGIFIAGMFTAFLFRFILVDKQITHFHANFALYVNGQRDAFDSFVFYEEIAACTNGESDNPRSRVHMHGNINHIVHVHDRAVTWGHFFANLGYTLGNKILTTNSGVYVDGQDGKHLRFIINGQPAAVMANEVIHSEDVLLIDFGSDDISTLAARYTTIEKDAHEYNQQPDPSACKGGESEPFTDRVKRTIGIGSSH